MKWHGTERKITVALAMGLFIASAMVAQTGGTSAKPQKEAVAAENKSPAQTSPSSEETPASDQHDTIKVHGHWVIVIRNADGSVDSHHEFENAFYQGVGDRVLAKILTRNAWVGLWAIKLDGPSAGTGPCTAGGSAAACEIGESNVYALSGAQVFENLTVQMGEANQTTVVLSGSAKSTNGGQIGIVFTTLGYCNSATAVPSSCSGSYYLTLTSPTPITVLAGQSIDVTVTISFS
jgi:hypothetical protein